ncbi:ABC transporter permease [Sphingomonas ginkgonis]|uniref:ABC transporter permease n=1 Tax=Sphingomonas ginkgonis TaxID=2315330 RepID=A0A3R9YKR1_9SPHN|nr:ABC transporter permease [Sphingomonas ginkgonis]RST30012.1 ABC transporter permease [Sphingomonas ginkgonis]
MTRFRRMIEAAFVIGRRDFTATIFSKTFILFLVGPFFPVLFGGLFGTIAGKTAADSAAPHIAVLASPAEVGRLQAARAQLAEAIPGDQLPELRPVAPAGRPGRQVQALLTAPDPPLAVLSGGLERPLLTGSLGSDSDPARQMRWIVAAARQPAAAPLAPLAVVRAGPGAPPPAAEREKTARAGQVVLFFFTLLLAGMLLSQLIEEKSNKVIEIVAAAVPVEAMFVGKLFGMLCVSLVGIVIWVSTVVAAIFAFAPDLAPRIPVPAVGWPLFLVMGALYFVMSYLLLGAAFLGIGAHASTAREVQTMSMPVTMSQLALFALASAAVGQYDRPIGLAAALFPLSSPLTMVARAAESGVLWPHLVALAWQALWVALILLFVARLFRRSVLKSGAQRPARRWWGRREAASRA